MIDSSTKVSFSNFVRQKEFVKHIGRYLNIHSNISRAALITYGSATRTSVSFDDYKANKFEQLVNDAKYIGGTRRMDRAIEVITFLALIQ